MFFESFLLNLAVIIILILALIFDYVTKFFSYWYIRHIHYKYPLPFFGSDYHRVLGLRNTTEEVNTLCHQYENEKFVGCIKSRIPDLIVKDPEIIKLMLSKESENFQSRGLCLDRSQDGCLRSNLFYADNEKWDLLRENFESILKGRMRKFEQSKKNVDKYLDEVEGEVNVVKYLQNVMNGVIKDLLFSKPLTLEEKTLLLNLTTELQTVTFISKLKTYLKNIFPSIYTLLGISSLMSKSNSKLNKLAQKSDLYEDVKTLNFATSSKGKGKLNQTLETDTAFSILSSFITEGYTPCLNTITCLLYELSKDQSLQQNVRDSSGINECDYLDVAVKEVMRLYPSYSVISRKCTKAFKFPESDLLIDRGVTLNIPVEVLHKDQKYFKNPHKFDVERFTGTAERPEYSYIPYGVGPKKCPAEDLSKSIIREVSLAILRKYKVESSSKTPASVKFTDHNFGRVLNTDIWLKFSPFKGMKLRQK